MPREIRVLLVDDSGIVLTILTKMLSSDPEIKVVGTSRNGTEALDLIPKLNPSVVCTDLHMPGMDGFELTEAIMAKFPRPILVVSASVQADDQQNIFKLLKAGAVDVFPKPLGGSKADYDLRANELIGKVKLLSGVSVVGRRNQSSGIAPQKTSVPSLEWFSALRVVAIGASTGGPQVLERLFSQLPKEFPLPILCVQHISGWFLQGLVDWLDSSCPLGVKIAEPGELPSAGTIYFPPPDTHLVIGAEGKFDTSMAPPYKGHRPSVNVSFTSVANYFGGTALAILLTGMGDDGALGMRDVHQTGGITVAQDQASCVVFGMPMKAIELGAARYVFSESQIASMLSLQLPAVVRVTP